ncbi:putative galactocerebrosidase, partial [Apostichopus japonicus]
AKISKLYVWYSKLGFSGDESTLFIQKESISVVNGSFSLSLGKDEVYTLTTKSSGMKGSYPTSPPSAPFPVKLVDQFEGYDIYGEAFGFADQAGTFEIRDSGEGSHGKVMQQVATDAPVRWCLEAALPITYFGSYNWTAVSFSIDAKVASSTGGAVIASRVEQGGCRTHNSGGIFFFVFTNGTFLVTSNIMKLDVLASGQAQVSANKWFKMELSVSTKSVTSGKLDGKELFNLTQVPASVPSSGFIAVGASDFSTNSPMMFDNFNLTSAST